MVSERPIVSVGLDEATVRLTERQDALRAEKQLTAPATGKEDDAATERTASKTAPVETARQVEKTSLRREPRGKLISRAADDGPSYCMIVAGENYKTFRYSRAILHA